MKLKKNLNKSEVSNGTVSPVDRKYNEMKMTMILVGAVGIETSVAVAAAAR